YSRMQDRAEHWWKGDRGKREKDRAARLLDEYVMKCAGIARIGLQGDLPGFATLALDGLRAEFVSQEAGRIKNAYLRRLGVAAGIAAVLFFAGFAATKYFQCTGLVGQHRAFLLAAGAASIGTWLSFSVRRVTLSFNDLGMLEDDLLDPSIRVLFVV